MRIVIDTNVVISAVFFGGAPRRVIEAVLHDRVQSFVSRAIASEDEEIVAEMLNRRQGRLNTQAFAAFLGKLSFVEPMSNVKICRDPDDDKFISCAVDAKAYYIVSGDKDLLEIGKYKNIEIVTVAEFEKILNDESR